MPVLTALKPTRQKGRYAIHVDGVFAFAVSEAFVARNGLYEGRQYNEADYEGLKSAAGTEAALGHAYRLLAHRMRSQAELRRRLRQKGHAIGHVDAVLSRLANEGLLDDEAFSRAFVSDRVALSGWGRERIGRELAREGVSDEIIQAALTHLQDSDEHERALAALRRRGPAHPPLDRASRRACDFLARRGFDGRTIHRVVGQWLGGEPPSD